jgi:acyl-CoA thioesterase
MNPHLFDQAIRLAPAGENRFSGHTSPAYWNMLGPFGGITAATVLAGVMQHPALLGEPLSLTVNYAGPIAEGPFMLEVVPVRTNRSTQHWSVTLSQTDARGAFVVATTATAVTAARRETWSSSDMPMPAVPSAADSVERPFMNGVEWLERYELRPVVGPIPERWEGQGDDGLSQLWMRDAPPRPLDFPSLAAMCDIFFPRVWLRRAVRVPAGTVSLTVYFHANARDLVQVGDSALLGQARALEYRNGFFDQSAQVWSREGHMLATSHQIVYFKE